MEFQTLAILNLTPDSFSDGGKISEYQELKNQIISLRSAGVSCFDIGAESTAPFNDPISNDEEWNRLEGLFFNHYQHFQFQRSDTLSFDTYQVETIKKILEFFKGRGTSCPEIIWNDVSGQFDQEVKTLLKQNPGLKYVYCHNLAPERNLCSSHMDYADSESKLNDWLLNFKTDFSKVLTEAKIEKLDQQLIFDPCFGFSKTKEQNYLLINEMPNLIKEFPELPWLLGISRKSFLKALCPDEDTDFTGREVAQSLILQYWESTITSKNVMVRIHDPRIINMIHRCQKMFKLS